MRKLNVTDGRTDGRTDGWTDGRTDGRMDGRTDGRTDGWTDGWTDGVFQYLPSRVFGAAGDKNRLSRKVVNILNVA